MIYICIPTHNEQQTVGVVLWKLRQVLTEFHRDYQLLVADDASTDKTTDVLEPYTRVLPLTVIRSETRQGYAASLEMLLREAVRRSEYPKRDVIVTLQADFSEEPDDIVGLIKRMEAGADVAVGIKVGSAPETRMRRIARSLSSFFTRRQSWPEGVVTPFDGYRAYRLHAVKRAMEERDGRRLLRYDGWAGHAELLRAVLPHARRVETLNVEARPDRLQRPRRERPLTAAWQVRAMAAGAEPQGLASVEELDRIAATASRSRERAALNGSTLRASRPNGRDRRGPHDARSEARERPRDRARPSRGERPERPRRGADGRSEARTGERSRGDAARRPRGEARPAGGDSRRRQTRPSGAAATDELLPTAGPPAPGESPEQALPAAEGAAKKRRRRRRGRGGATAAEAAAGQADGVGAEASRAAMQELDELLGGLDTDPGRGAAAAGPARSEDAGGDPLTDPGEGDEAAATGEKKRRRRGGRRGGRGRRRSAGAEAAAGAGDEANTTSEAGAVTGEAAGSAGAGGATGGEEAVRPPQGGGELRSETDGGPEKD